jgi:arylsulfatase A-like enzyme
MRPVSRRTLGLAVVTLLASSCWSGSEEPTEVAQRPKAGKRAPGAGKGGKAATARPVKPKGPAPTGPNVLILVWDTVRADHLSAYGYGLDTSPNLKAFAKEGVLYERAISPAMWTLPSHSAMFTGLPESANGATADHKWLDEKFPTMAESFSDYGYDTYLFSANPYLQDHTNVGQGFDAREYPWDAKWKRKAAANTRAKLIADDASTELSPAYVEGEFSSGRPNDKVKEAGPVSAEALLAWVDGRAEAARPWFAVINYMEAHAPRIPSIESRSALFDVAAIAQQKKVDESYGRLLAYTTNVREYTDAELATIGQVYDASLRDLDKATGALFDTLRERGVLDNTIVVVTSDHGEHLGEHHLLDHKYSVYNALVHVPLVIRYPARLKPAVVTQVVSNLGIWGTVAELAGAPPPPEGTLSPSLVDPSKVKPIAFSELVAATPMALGRMAKAGEQFEWGPFLRTYAAVQDNAHKCIISHAKGGGDEQRKLFDLIADPLEATDLPAAKAKDAAALCDEIATWRTTFKAYDPSTGEKPPPRASDPELAARLQALGYLDEGVKPEDAPADKKPASEGK